MITFGVTNSTIKRLEKDTPINQQVLYAVGIAHNVVYMKTYDSP